MPEFSIVVPVYCAEAYLRACLDSIRCQETEASYEVIMVDDGSPDRSGAICDVYMSMDARFRVIHKENGGVSTARNVGMEAATGEYVLFLDSDDLWGSRYLAQFEPFLERRLDMVQTGAQTFTQKIGDGVNLYAAVKPQDGEGGIAYLQRCFRNNTLPSYGPYYYLYRRSFLVEHHLRFPDGLAVNEDLDFNLRCLSQAKSVAKTEGPAQYFYRQHSASTVHAPSPKHQLMRLQTTSHWFDQFPVPPMANLFVHSAIPVATLGTRSQVQELTNCIQEHRRIFRFASGWKCKLAVSLFRIFGCYWGSWIYMAMVARRRKILNRVRKLVVKNPLHYYQI